MTRSRVAAVLIPFAFAVVLVGCGTSGGDDASDATTTTRPAAASTTTASSETTAGETTETTEQTETTEGTETTEAGGDDDICVPLKVLSDYDKDSADLIAAGDWTAIQAFFVDNTDDVLAAYDDAIALDTDQSADLAELRKITEGTSELAGESTDLMDLSGKLLALPGIQSAGEAGLRLNTFAEATCGFATGGAGN